MHHSKRITNHPNNILLPAVNKNLVISFNTLTGNIQLVVLISNLSLANICGSCQLNFQLVSG